MFALLHENGQAVAMAQGILGVLSWTALVGREPGSATRATGERALRAAGLVPRYALELGSNEAVKRAVLAGLGVGMLSRYALDVEERAGLLTVLPVAGFAGQRLLYIARHREAPLTAAQATFLALARERGAPPHRSATRMHPVTASAIEQLTCGARRPAQ